MQRRIVQAALGSAGVVVISGSLLAAPDLLSEISVNAALATISEPIRSAERLFAPTRGGEPTWLARSDAADAPAASTFRPSRIEPRPVAGMVLASVDPAAVADVLQLEPPAVRTLPLNEEAIPETVYKGPDALKLVQMPVPPQRPADLPFFSAPRFKTPAELLGLAGTSRDRAQRCLTQAVYFEARSEPYRGQVAVAQVVMNRVFSPYYPGEVCAVVFQNAHRYLSCQFTFTCEGRALRVTEHGAWRRAKRIAQQTLDGEIWRPEVAKATHYHADYVSPKWASEMRTLAKHGRHIFYRPHRWGDGRGEAGWVFVHRSPIPRPRPVEVASVPGLSPGLSDGIALASALDVEGW